MMTTCLMWYIIIFGVDCSPIPHQKTQGATNHTKRQAPRYFFQFHMPTSKLVCFFPSLRGWDCWVLCLFSWQKIAVICLCALGIFLTYSLCNSIFFDICIFPCWHKSPSLGIFIIINGITLSDQPKKDRNNERQSSHRKPKNHERSVRQVRKQARKL